MIRWRGLTFVCPQKFQDKLVHMCLNNFRHDLSIALMLYTFEWFNGMCTKAHDMEIYLKKCKKIVKVGGRTGHLLTKTIAPKERAPYALKSSTSKKVSLVKSRKLRNTIPVIFQVSYKALSRQK